MGNQTTLPDFSTVAPLRTLSVPAGSLHVHVSMPCPLKTPFKQLFIPFVEAWNRDTSRPPLYWPGMGGCTDEAMDQSFGNGMPDVLVTSGYNLLFSKPFRQRYIESGIYGQLPLDFYPASYPRQLLDASQKFGVGFLGFSSWGLVHDTTFSPSPEVPASWHDLVRPGFRQQFSIHGCHGHAGNLSMLLALVRAQGEKALSGLAGNIKKVRHFAELIDEMGSSSPQKTPFYILPYSAIAHIPSKKQVQIVPLNDSVLTPMMCLVKQSEIARSRDLLHFFAGKEFKQLLLRGAYFQPDGLDGIEHHGFDDMQELSRVYYEGAEPLLSVFTTLLGDKMSK
ncbi:MAG: ABC transporter substrate-binding protein [Breznakibacter sp.]